MFNLNEWARRPIYEPRPRLCAGRFGYVAHRFPIKNGISWRDVMVRSNQNRLINLVVVKND